MSRPMHRIISIVNTACAVLWLVACGGGGSSGSEVPIDTTPPTNGADQALADNTAYSSARNGSLPGATEAAAVTHHSITLGGQTIAYTARAGHLIAREPVTARAEATFYYVAYTADGAAPANCPVTFFYNGGPGLSTAIAPFTNGSFYSVDADAALMRDFVLRWLVANDRLASPKFCLASLTVGPARQYWPRFCTRRACGWTA